MSHEKMTKLCRPSSILVSNGEVFIADMMNHRVRKLLRNGQLVTIAGSGIKGYNGDDQLATDAQLYYPYSIAVSSSNQVYISEMHGNRIRKIDCNGMISTIAGTGIGGYNGDDKLAVNAQLNIPFGLFVTEDEEVLFADYENCRVRRIDRNGIISTIAGNGKHRYNGYDELGIIGDDGEGDGQLATSIPLNNPTSVFQYRNDIYFTETGSGGIRKIDRNSIISTIAGTGSENNYPESVLVHNDQVYFSDRLIHRVRTVLPNGTIQTIAGTEKGEFNGDDMLATDTSLRRPCGIFIDATDGQIYIADSDNHCIRRMDRNGMMKIIVGTGGKNGYSGDVPFDFEKYPHVGPPKKPTIKPFPNYYHDLIVKYQSMDGYEPSRKKIKQ